MCTIAWGIRDGELWACFNRDEQRMRAEAELPKEHGDPDQSVIYARDPDGGGTWFAVNKSGFVVALLNLYSSAKGHGSGFRSRGEIVEQLIRTASADAAAQCIRGIPFNEFRPCTIFILSMEKGRQFIWDGAVFEETKPCAAFWTTSSYQSEAVKAYRKSEWDRLTSTTGTDLATASIVLSQRHEDGAFGMTMDRDDARTVSRIETKIGNGKCQFLYYRRQAGGYGFEEPVRLQWDR